MADDVDLPTLLLLAAVLFGGMLFGALWQNVLGRWGDSRRPGPLDRPYPTPPQHKQPCPAMASVTARSESRFAKIAAENATASQRTCQLSLDFCACSWNLTGNPYWSHT
jgi:hypothetical protein